MHVQIQVEFPKTDAFSWQFDGNAFTIGRDPECELKLTEEQAPSVSWRHARIELRNGNATIVDLNSSNGTFLNDQPVSGTHPLAVGDRVRLGRNGPILLVVKLRSGEQGRRDVEGALAFGFAPPSMNVAPSDAQGHKRDKVRPAPAGPFACTLPQGAPNVEAQSGVKTDRPPATPHSSSTRELLIGYQTRQQSQRLITGIVTGVLALLLVAVLFGYPGYLRPDYNETFRKGLIQRIGKSVVHIETPEGGGTGFVLDNDGGILTNHHVIWSAREDRSAAEVTVRFHDGTELRANTFLAASPDTDLVLLYVKPHSNSPRPLPLAARSPEIGSEVHAFGSALGFQGSHSKGEVVEIRRGENVVTQMRRLTGVTMSVDPDSQWVQTTAPILHGNSGGPLVNMDGEVIGVNTFGPAETLNFASGVPNIRDVIGMVNGQKTPLSELPRR